VTLEDVLSDEDNKPIPDSQFFLSRLVEVAEVYITTSRVKVDLYPESDLVTLVEAVQMWLDRHGYPVVPIYSGQGRPKADIYITSNKTLVYNGDFLDVLSEVEKRTS